MDSERLEKGLGYTRFEIISDFSFKLLFAEKLEGNSTEMDFRSLREETRQEFVSAMGICAGSPF